MHASDVECALGKGFLKARQGAATGAEELSYDVVVRRTGRVR
ncbi:hypothetical protein ACHBTE_19320 [Streptomyces sp. M41]